MFLRVFPNIGVSRTRNAERDKSNPIKNSGIRTVTFTNSPISFPYRKYLEKTHVFSPSSISISEGNEGLGERSADFFVGKVKKNPNAVIVFPTGSTPGPVYKEIIRRFKEDKSLDLSNVTFFNLDEYIGLPKDHPLSYHFYMENVLYKHLRDIDPNRAPKSENINIPYVETCSDDFNSDGNLTESGIKKAEESASSYREKFLSAISKNESGLADLVILGIGGAYPAKDEQSGETISKGGHLAFNEPGSSPEDKTRPLPLTAKTIGDTRYRFRNVEYLLENNLMSGKYASSVPKWAITMGIEEIVRHTETAILLANGEEKAPVINVFSQSSPCADFPASYLKLHPDYHLILDYDAASSTSYVKRPWATPDLLNDISNEDLIRQIVIEALIENNIKVSGLEREHLEKVGVSGHLLDECLKILDSIKTDATSFLNDQMLNDFSSFKGKKILLTSPHPDDDVICCSAIIKKLKEAGADVHVAYITSGENAVRNDLAERVLPNNFNSLSEKEKTVALKNARIETRKAEALNGVRELGLSDSNTTFLSLPFYYTRGFVHLNPLREEADIKPIENLIVDYKPDYIFYSAENDPHGAHGLSAKAIKSALKNIPFAKDIKFWGYRGAYNEWALHKDPEKLKIVPYDDGTWRFKKSAIDAHISQKNPMYPSFDKREFDERALDRNLATGRVLNLLGYTTDPYAEVFKTFTYDEFINS